MNGNKLESMIFLVFIPPRISNLCWGGRILRDPISRHTPSYLLHKVQKQNEHSIVVEQDVLKEEDFPP